MSELDTAIEALRQSQNFNEYQRSLGAALNKCITHEEINLIKEIMNKEKNRLLETNKQFKTIMTRKTVEAKIQKDESRAINIAKTAEAEARSRISSTMLEPNAEDWIARTKLKTVDLEELERRIDDKLGCPNPKCEDHGKNRKNIMNDVPTCMRCWHRLVPKSKFKDYNRAHWRRFNRKRVKS